MLSSKSCLCDVTFAACSSSSEAMSKPFQQISLLSFFIWVMAAATAANFFSGASSPKTFKLLTKEAANFL